MKLTLHGIDDGPVLTDLAAFIDANDFNPDEIESITADLNAQGYAYYGGGAAPLVEIRSEK